MKFAKIVFGIAGVWGILVLAPLFFLVDLTGRKYAPPGGYPHFSTDSSPSQPHFNSYSW